MSLKTTYSLVFFNRNLILNDLNSKYKKINVEIKKNID